MALRVLRTTEGDGAAADLDSYASMAGLTEELCIATYELRRICNDVAHLKVEGVPLSTLERAAAEFPDEEYRDDVNAAVALFKHLHIANR